MVVNNITKCIRKGLCICGCFIFAACGQKKEHNDYAYLVNLTRGNKVEINKIISYYLEQNEADKIKAIEYILKNLPDQYSTNYYLLKVNPDSASQDTIKIGYSIPYDSLVSSIQKGYEVKADTIKDIDVIRSDFFQDHVETAYNAWKNKVWNKAVSFKEFTHEILPYRCQNEKLDNPTSIVRNRFFINDMLIVKADKDSVAALGRLISGIVSGNLKDMSGVEFLSNVSYRSLLMHNDYLRDYEDMHIFTVKLLRSFGVPCRIRYTLSKRGSSVSPYSSQIINEKTNSLNDQVHCRELSKVYQLSFDKANWNNPQDELLSLGVLAKNIPLTLFIPKMHDITSQVTTTKTIQLPIPEDLRDEKVIYLCNYGNNGWKAVSWGKVNRKDGIISFPKMGTGMLYQMASYNAGFTKVIGSPVIVDSLGKTSILDLKIKGNIFGSLVFNEDGKNSKLKPLEKYQLLLWSKAINKWEKVQNLTVTANSIVEVKNLDKNGLYTLIKGEDEFNERDCKIFTINHEKKQVWW